MEYSPPPLFKQGASARAKMMICACLSIALLLFDSRVGALTVVRQVVGTVLYPLQVVAMLPRDAMVGVGTYFSTLSGLERRVRELQTQQIAVAQTLQQAQLMQVENAQLRRLLEARDKVPGKTMLAEILYDARDVFTRKVILDRGTQQGVKAGLPVIDNQGVVGQVTRVFPFTSEVTLLTDKEQAIPVQVLRNGLRSVAYGRGQSGNLDLRFMAPNADVVVGDILVTSGIDGVYPAGLAVARVTHVENSANGMFGRVVCQPLAGIERNTQLLILMSRPEMPPRPREEDTSKPVKKKKAADTAAPAAATATGAAAAAPAAATATGAAAAAGDANAKVPAAAGTAPGLRPATPAAAQPGTAQPAATGTTRAAAPNAGAAPRTTAPTAVPKTAAAPRGAATNATAAPQGGIPATTAPRSAAPAATAAPRTPAAAPATTSPAAPRETR